MSRRSGFEHRDSGWQGLIWAGGAAALVTLVLAVGVALAWAVGSGPGAMPTLTDAAPQTPTPRALSFASAPPSPTAPSVAPTAEGNIAVETPRADAAEMVIVSTPALMEMAIEDDATSDPGDADPGDAVLEASSEDAFLALASGSWTANDGALVTSGNDAVSERWLPVTTVPGPNFAVDAEIRVVGTLDSVCDQSFGIAGGSPVASLVFGGGVIFPCSGGPPVARLTDVTTWEDGYNADPVLAEESFKPGEKWRAYRFEMRGGQLRLLVDGKMVIDAAADPGIDPAATDVEVGLWSQGVGLEVRELTVLALPA